MNFCCDGFLSFLESIPDSITSFDALIEVVTRELSPLAGQIGLGRLDMRIHTNPMPFEAENNTICRTLYQHPSVSEECSLTDTYHDGEETVVSFYSFPKKDHNWSEQELKMLHFLTHQLFLLSSRVMLVSSMQKASITDSLTGLLNTPGFMKYGSIMEQNGELTDYAAIYLNLKSFRYINQRFGHRHGDDVLRRFAQRIKSFLQPDELLGRLGGDNFALLVRRERFDSILDSLLCVRVHVQLEDFVNTFDLSARAGIYAIRPGDTMNEVLNRITAACMLAKSSLHHNAIWFRDMMMEQYVHDKEISDLFPSAIESNEFVVYYQPKVLLDGQTLCGCEALVRWNRNGNIIQPSEFVPVLEKEGTICILDFYVLECVCRDIRTWLEMGIEPVRVSTNFSKVHLHNKNLAKDILRILDRYEIDAKYIEIELTESSGYEDFDALSEFVNTMKSHGVHTSIDDFGTGYSSLNLLKDLNIDKIKLDKSFLTQNEERNKSDEIVIKTIINMASDLDMQVVCEGVETTEQANFLKSLHCPIAQGFLFDEPLAHDEFEERLRKSRVYNRM